MIEATIERVGHLVGSSAPGEADIPFLTFDDMEPAWSAIDDQRANWVSHGMVPG